MTRERYKITALAAKVVIEVRGGVAECTTCPEGVEVEIIGHDNLDATCGECGDHPQAPGSDKCTECDILEARGIHA